MDESRFHCPPETKNFIIDSAWEVLTSNLEFSVTFNDATSPISNDSRDYYSTHANWWPNPDTQDGLPYVLTEQINPASRQDIDQLTGLYLATLKCSLAFHLTGEEKFAEHAIKLVRTFFLSEETGMRPNMAHSKIIPGINEEGSFEVATLSNRVRKLWDAIETLRISEHWAPCDEAGMQVWSRQFLNWMETAPTAIKEYNATNNHSTAYHLIAVILAKYIGEDDKALTYGCHFANTLIPVQFDADGSQPLEMWRSDNLFYHVYNLKSSIDILSVVNDLGMDFGTALDMPLKFLLPYLAGEQEWLYWPAEPRPHNLKWEHDLLIEAAHVLDRPDLYDLGASLYSGALLDEYVWPRSIPGPVPLLVMNYPNPFNAGTMIHFKLEKPSPVTVEVFDLAGRLIRTLFHGTPESQTSTIYWDGRGNNGAILPAGTYLYQVRSGQLVGTNKTVLLK